MTSNQIHIEMLSCRSLIEQYAETLERGEFLSVDSVSAELEQQIKKSLLAVFHAGEVAAEGERR